MDLAGFDLETDTTNILRLPVHRLTNLGYRFQVLPPPLSGKLLRDLASVSDEWLMTIRSNEKHFSSGWFDEDYLRSCPVAVVYTRENLIGAFANLLPGYGRDEVGVDVVRHRHDIPSGLLEYLFVNMLDWAKDTGYTHFDLGAAVPANQEDVAEDAEIGWPLHYIHEHLAHLYRHKGSRSFKEKFRPQWLPLYLAYPIGVSLAPVTIALIRADEGADFVWGYFRGLSRPESQRV